MGKPLVSGSAIGAEGQLSVYNHNGGPCYRCLYPQQPVATSIVDEGAKTCSDNGVLGTVPGLIGILQAIETVKVLTKTGSTMHDRLLMYDSLQSSFFNFKKPSKRKQDCLVCGTSPTIRSIVDSYYSIKSYRGPSTCNNDIAENINDDDPSSCGIDANAQTDKLFLHHMSCRDYYDRIRCKNIPHVLLDVRVKEQYDLCSLSGSINIPLSDLHRWLSSPSLPPTAAALAVSAELDRIVKTAALSCIKSSPKADNGGSNSNDGDNCITPPTIYCICRRGIASLHAAKMLIEKQQQQGNHKEDGANSDNGSRRINPLWSIKNVYGGLDAWRNEVDPAFPKY